MGFGDGEMSGNKGGNTGSLLLGLEPEGDGCRKNILSSMVFSSPPPSKPKLDPSLIFSSERYVEREINGLKRWFPTGDGDTRPNGLGDEKLIDGIKSELGLLMVSLDRESDLHAAVLVR